MKIRNGFVSNSSTSSFCIFGTTIDKSEIYNDETFKELVKREFEDDEFDEDSGYEGLEILGDILHKEYNLSQRTPYYYEDVYIGRSWTSLRDEETALSFKKEVEKNIKAFLAKYLPSINNEIECETHQEAWRDG